MRSTGRWLLSITCVLICATANAQPSEQSSDGARQIVRQAARTELADDAADHSLWLYYEVDHKPRGGVVQWAAQTRKGDLDRVLQQDGRNLTPEQQRSRMDRFIHDSAAQAKQAHSGQQDDRRAAQMLNMLPKAFIWTKVKDQGTTTILHFRPDPAFHAPSWESRVFASMEGDLVVDTAEHRIVSLRGKLIRKVKFGWGILGELESGGTFDVERRQVGHGVWQITETHVHIQGHAILFHSISDQEDDVKSKFEELPANITLEDARQRLLQMK